ncbi:MAG TPA: methyltransferase domain-containing protein [Pseudomonadales bacterium]|nr:methyltransferase domain-containing protein [Pseudomonadales bacterium]
MKTNIAYIPALRWNGLTPFYDLVLSKGMREERFKRELIRQARIEPGQSVLDLGCGTATLTVMLKQAHPDANITGLDGDPAVLQIGRAKADTARVRLILDQGMAYDLPYPDGSFDRVVSSLMFHHLTTQQKLQAIKEVYRVLRPGGLFLIVDFGQPRGIWSRLVSPIMERLEEVSDNHKGLLLAMLRLAHFEGVTNSIYFATIFGTLSLYSGQKNRLK